MYVCVCLCVCTRHVYAPLTSMGYSKFTGQLAVFALSGFFHEVPVIIVTSHTVEPLNVDMHALGPSILSVVERLSSFRGYFVYRVCIQWYIWFVLCLEACPLSECPLSEVCKTVTVLSLFDSTW